MTKLETADLRGESSTADNKKINASFLFGGFIASYESLSVYADDFYDKLNQFQAIFFTYSLLLFTTAMILANNLFLTAFNTLILFFPSATFLS